MRYQKIQVAAGNTQQGSGEPGAWREMLVQVENQARLQADRMACLCSYTPVEIIAACKLIPWRLLPLNREKLQEDIYLHSTLCSFVRVALEKACLDETLQGAVVLNSCHAARHFSYTFDRLFPRKYHFLLDLPYDSSPAAIDFWAGELRELHCSLARWRGIEACRDALQEQIILYRQNRERLAALYRSRTGEVAISGSELIHLVQASMLLPPRRFSELLTLYEHHAQLQGKRGCFYQAPRLLLLGSVPGRETVSLIEEQGGLIILDDLCTGRRAVSVEGAPAAGEDPYHYLSRLYLKRSPCARMKSSFSALQQLDRLVQEYSIDGLILYYLKFCDPWYYLGQLLKEKSGEVPVLILEGELAGAGSTGQLRTRIDAFLEMLHR